MKPSPQPPMDLRLEIERLDWYHTMELAPGVVTPGWFDLRTVVDQVPLPPSLAGKRCLDIGTFDGFWAFEMERRGADEVVAIDLLDPAEWDWPLGSDEKTIEEIGKRKAMGAGFIIARRALGSSVERIERSVYDLDRSVAGDFDLVYLGSILLHLRDPIRALERVRDVCAGELIAVDAIDLPLSWMLRRKPVATLDGRGRPWWWKANAAGLGRMIEAGGFEIIQPPRRIFMPLGPGQGRVPFHPRLLPSWEGREALLAGWRGDPHAVVVARPRA